MTAPTTGTSPYVCPLSPALQAHIDREAAAAPPLSAETRARITRLLLPYCTTRPAQPAAPTQVGAA